jgi:catechol 2,3-dioxygenase-like lactoylglutathione lyase family enzyme
MNFKKYIISTNNKKRTLMNDPEIRIALTVDSFDKAVDFYQNGLGLKFGEKWENGGNGLILWAGKAGFEIFDQAYAAGIDQVETGKRISGKIRLALEVDDLEKSLKNAIEHGAVLIHEPVQTTWGDLNARIQAPDGMQITLFQPQKNLHPTIE